jgi:hypothetical protein
MCFSQFLSHYFLLQNDTNCFIPSRNLIDFTYRYRKVTMDTTRRTHRDDSSKSAQNILVIGGTDLAVAVARYLAQGGQSVTIVAKDQPTTVADGVTPIPHEVSDASDIRAIASEVADVDLVVVMVESDSEALLLGYLVRRELDPCDVVTGISNPSRDPAFEGTGVDRIELPRLLAEKIGDRYE